MGMTTSEFSDATDVLEVIGVVTGALAAPRAEMAMKVMPGQGTEVAGDMPGKGSATVGKLHGQCTTATVPSTDDQGTKRVSASRKKDDHVQSGFLV
ncbi:hypothetical protein GUJ93_ZPchr0010g7328 [Zizania palustris]|uniref:Uncharacterized protein n=1 Tax=Zizania palustris TaxID=103762 RepID=A0A8J5W778_ZIZPA|nr:hypothetical protein GUJ93_ZPchr0010g7328 [Zizania palustris]